MEVKLSLHQDHVGVLLENTSTIEVRLWELDNSWGYWSISFELSGESGTSFSTIRHRHDTEFTINGPNDFALAPSERHEFLINLNDGWWESDQTFSALKDETFSVRVLYKVDPSPEAEKYDVYVGSIVSDWVASNPPHEWLLMKT